jgi:HEAT repeats
MSTSPPRAVVRWLTAQTFAFGVTLALLIIPANSLFLDAYGSEWLPATYIAIAVVGSGASAFIARAARRTRLVQVAAVTLGAFALLFAASWAILVAGGAWASAVLLVLFPMALQIGFVFIGGQAGRLLDVRQMKELFPRVVSGFAIGFLIGGLLGIPLLALLGSTENLLVATTLAQLAFLGLLLLTDRRFPEVRTTHHEDGSPVARPPLRMLFASGIALLLLAYQVLSAMGSQVVDFLLFDRASAQYSGDDLTRFLSTYTAALNLIDILFLALLAGPLMRRFGLRLGLTFNPVVVVGILAVMVVVAVGSGTASFGLFVLAGVLRISDIAATDGTTRTSINAAFQVVQREERLAVQAVVEGIGVPVAIGATGVLLLALDALDLGVGAVIVFGLVLCVIWTVVAVGVYRSYKHALADELRRGSSLAGDFAVSEEADVAAVQALLRSDDARNVRVGLDLLAGISSTASEVELRQLAEHADPEVRARALSQLAATGYAGDREGLVALLDDPERSVRAAALDAVVVADGDDPEVVRRVVAAVADPRTAGRANAALRRLGEVGIPVLAAELGRSGKTPRAPLVRAAAGAACEQGIEVIAPALDHHDRAVVLTALDALDAHDARDVVPSDVLERAFQDASTLAAHALAARSKLATEDTSLARALEDEIDLARRLVIAVLALRHGERIREAVRAIDHGEGARRALGVEALDVVLTREEAAVALPLVRYDLTVEQRAAALRRAAASVPSEEWIADIAHDPDGVWRSPWLQSCALDAMRSS